MKKYGISTLLTTCLLLSGCSGLKNIQDLTYVVAIGMDYDKEKKEYTAYLQSLNFSNVAKSESGRPVEPVPAFIASAKGETLNLAVSKLYNKSEPSLFFGHVNTLLLSTSIIKDHFGEVIKEVGRNRSLRHSLIIMTTEEKIEDVFNINALFNYPSVFTILYKYSEDKKYQDDIKPLTLMHFIRNYFEPMGVAKLPKVKIDKDSWKAGKSYPVLFFDGYDVFQQRKFIGSVPFRDAVVINWLQDKNIVLDRRVEKEGKLVAAVRIVSPKMKMKYEKGTTSPKFSINISLTADVLEKVENIPIKELEKLIIEDIKKNVTRIYNDGVENKADFLNVGNKWYIRHPKQYGALKQTKQFYLEKDSLKNVNVKVQVFHFNSYKYDERWGDVPGGRF